MTSAGIEPGYCRFIVQRLNHCATAVPACSVSHLYYLTSDLRHSAIRVQPTVLHFIIHFHEKLPEIRVKNARGCTKAKQSTYLEGAQF